MKKLFLISTVMALTGCNMFMSDNCYKIKKMQLEKEAAYDKPVYSPISVEGPCSFEMKEGSKLNVNVPNQTLMDNKYKLEKEK